MLLPQYSLRWLLAIMTVAAIVFSIVALGIHGSRWAAAVSVGVLALVILVVVHIVLFMLVWSVSAASERRRAGDTPFH